MKETTVQIDGMMSIFDDAGVDVLNMKPTKEVL